MGAHCNGLRDCGSTAVTERRDLTAQGYRRFRCRDCATQFNERSNGVLNRASVLSAKPICRIMLLEATHTSDPSIDPDGPVQVDCSGKHLSCGGLCGPA